MNQCCTGIVGNLAGHRTETLRSKAGKNNVLVDAVFRYALYVQRNSDFLMLHTEQFDTAHFTYLTQTVSHHLGVIFHLVRRTLIALQRQQDTARVAEIVNHDNRQQSRRQLHLLHDTHSAADLRPRLVGVHHLRSKGGKYIAHAILAQAVRLALVYLGESKQVLLNRFSHLLFHLLRRGTRIDTHNQTQTDGHLREFILVHPAQGKDAKHHQHRNHRIDDTAAAHGGFYMISFSHTIFKFSNH